MRSFPLEGGRGIDQAGTRARRIVERLVNTEATAHLTATDRIDA